MLSGSDGKWGRTDSADDDADDYDADDDADDHDAGDAVTHQYDDGYTFVNYRNTTSATQKTAVAKLSPFSYSGFESILDADLTSIIESISHSFPNSASIIFFAMLGKLWCTQRVDFRHL